MDDIKKYKFLVIKSKKILSWEEYVSMLFFIKAQSKLLVSSVGYTKYELNNELFLLVLSYNMKILIKINEVNGDSKTKSLISANKKLYKLFFELTNFKVDIFNNTIEKFGSLNKKSRKRLLDLIATVPFLFIDVDLEYLEGFNDYLNSDKSNAMNQFNEVNNKINIFLRDKNF